MVVPIFACLVLATPARAFVPDTLPSLASSACRAAYLVYTDKATSNSRILPLQLPSAINMATSPGLNIGIDHDNISNNHYHNGDYIIHGILDHNYTTHTISFIDIGIKGSLCSSASAYAPAGPSMTLLLFTSLPIRLRGGVRVYYGKSIFGSLEIVLQVYL